MSPRFVVFANKYNFLFRKDDTTENGKFSNEEKKISNEKKTTFDREKLEPKPKPGGAEIIAKMQTEQTK